METVRSRRHPEPRGAISRVSRRLIFFAAVWGILVGSSLGGWAFGLFAIPGATLASLRLGPTTPLRLDPWAMVRFFARFLLESLRSGLDVARRALHPRVPMDPSFIIHRLRLSEEAPRVLLAATVTMLPGTVTAEIRGDRLIVHALDAAAAAGTRIDEMELRIARLFDSAAPGGPASDGDMPEGTGA